MRCCALSLQEVLLIGCLVKDNTVAYTRFTV